MGLHRQYALIEYRTCPASHQKLRAGDESGHRASRSMQANLGPADSCTILRMISDRVSR